MHNTSESGEPSCWCQAWLILWCALYGISHRHEIGYALYICTFVQWWFYHQLAQSINFICFDIGLMQLVTICRLQHLLTRACQGIIVHQKEWHSLWAGSFGAMTKHCPVTPAQFPAISMHSRYAHCFSIRNKHFSVTLRDFWSLSHFRWTHRNVNISGSSVCSSNSACSWFMCMWYFCRLQGLLTCKILAVGRKVHCFAKVVQWSAHLYVFCYVSNDRYLSHRMH